MVVEQLRLRQIRTYSPEPVADEVVAELLQLPQALLEILALDRQLLEPLLLGRVDPRRDRPHLEGLPARSLAQRRAGYGRGADDALPVQCEAHDELIGKMHRADPRGVADAGAAVDDTELPVAVLALGEGADAAKVSEVLRRASQIDRVVEHIEAAGAPVRYRRVRSALTELNSLAVQSGDERLAEFLSTDETVLAVMAAAVDVVEAEGAAVDRGDDAAAHLRRAVHWRRYSRGPVDALHRSCGADIARGSLRLLGRTR